MEHNMILSASGWRKIFVPSLNEEDKSEHIGKENTLLCALIAETWAQYFISKTNKKSPVLVVGMDSRPSGKEICNAAIKVFIHYGIKIEFLGITCAPEIMAYSKLRDGFFYVSASHNPIGHNGIKFGLNNGGVIDANEAKILIQNFQIKCNAINSQEHAQELLTSCSESSVKKEIEKSAKLKKRSLNAYTSFIKQVISGEENSKSQKKIFDSIKLGLSKKSLTILCDMNGSSRTMSIDEKFISDCGAKFIAFNEQCGHIAHAIIPEPENLIWCQKRMAELQNAGKSDVLLGYMPDCDGDRGNIVFWNEKTKNSQAIKAQEIFALCVLSELSFEIWKEQNWKISKKQKKLAVAVNCPTSMRIDEICKCFDAQIFRAEVGEANVVNCAREKRSEGYNVRIFGEGSNGGNITYPSSVRDPLASIFALIKLLTLRDFINKDGSITEGLFHLWCKKSNQENKYKANFTLADILETLPAYTTTGVSEKRAVLKVKTQDKGKLKLRFQKIFEQEWKQLKSELKEKYHFDSWECFTTNGTKEISGATQWNNGNGGLKIKFYDDKKNPLAFIWMRPSGTENVFRIMCDVKGNKVQTEKSLLEWESYMLEKADSISK